MQALQKHTIPFGYYKKKTQSLFNNVSDCRLFLHPLSLSLTLAHPSLVGVSSLLTFSHPVSMQG